MPDKTFLFLAQATIVGMIVAVHIIALRVTVRRFSLRRTPWRRAVHLLLWGIIIAIDLPLVHSVVFYKLYHPIWIDDLMHAVAPWYVMLHLNAAAFSGGLLLWEFVVRPLRGRFSRRRSLHSVLRAPEGSGDVQGAGTLRRGDESAELGRLESGRGASGPNTSGLIASSPNASGLIASRRQFLWNGGLAVAGLATSVTALRAMESTDDFTQERVVVKIPNLPEALKGTTIALISDIHSSVFMTRSDMERYVTALNGMKADIIVVAGDFVNSKLQEVYPFAEAFSRLRAPLGVYGVTGNHDYYTGEIAKVVSEVENCGIRLLHNENLAVEKGGEKLYLLGMDDADIYDIKPYLASGKSERGTIENLTSGIPNGAPTLFLCHKPYPFEEYSQLGVDLMLSGHTHGGQVVLAQLDNVNVSFASLASSYVAGLYGSRSNRRSQMYVSRGVGTVGIPMRLNCPPELTHIVLV